LSTPYAAAKGGWLGLALLLVFALVCCYTALLLRRCLDVAPYVRSYPDVGEAAFGKWGRWTISVMLYLELYAVAIEFLILEGDNLAQLFPSAGMAIGGAVLDPHEVFVVLAAVCMLPTVWLRELSVLSYVSASGVVASFLIVITVGWIGLFEGVGFHHRGSLVHWHGLPVAVGLYSFCYCGHAVFPSIYGSMRNRTQFSHVRSHNCSKLSRFNSQAFLDSRLRMCFLFTFVRFWVNVWYWVCLPYSLPKF
jgi:vesicular inhibitory amino acid transporter